MREASPLIKKFVSYLTEITVKETLYLFVCRETSAHILPSHPQNGSRANTQSKHEAYLSQVARGTWTTPDWELRYILLCCV